MWRLQQRPIGMADGPETRLTKPESQTLSRPPQGRGGARGSPGGPGPGRGRPFCRATALFGGLMVQICGKSSYLFCNRPFIYRILTPGSNPLQRRRKTGSAAAQVHCGRCSPHAPLGLFAWGLNQITAIKTCTKDQAAAVSLAHPPTVLNRARRTETMSP